jgi:hypothetical protein
MIDNAIAVSVMAFPLTYDRLVKVSSTAFAPAGNGTPMRTRLVRSVVAGWPSTVAVQPG